MYLLCYMHVCTPLYSQEETTIHYAYKESSRSVGNTFFSMHKILVSGFQDY